MIGDSLALASAFQFALANIAIAKAARKRSADNGVLLSIVATAALSTLILLLQPKQPFPESQVFFSAVGWFAASGILATVWGRLTLFKAVRYAGVVRATTVRRLTPFFSALLGWALLSESISGFGLLGMALMGASFALIYLDNNRKPENTELFADADIQRGYMFGLLCAIAYAFSYIVRKRGLETVPDASLGALVGSVAALMYYLLGCLLSSKFRSDLRALLTTPDPWQLFAAVSISAGQISQFMALNYIGVGRLAIINSAEIFLSSYLAVIIFKTERWPSQLIALATALATAGIILVATG